MDIPALVKNTLNSRKSIESYVENVMGDYIVRPAGSTGIGGFMFNIVDRESVVLTSEITDHYVEKNFAYQDHIALRPERFTMRGYVGEIADIIPAAALSVLTKIQSLSNIAPFMNEFSAQATQAYAKIAEVAAKAGNVLNQAQNIYDIFTNNTASNTKQEKAFAYFYSLWQSRVLVDVTTPYMVLKNMAIENIEVIQGGETRYISDFAVTFKRIRVASSRTLTKPTQGKRSKLSEAFASQQEGLFDPPKLSGSGRYESMVAETASGGQTAGSTFNAQGQPTSTDMLFAQSQIIAGIT